MSTAIKEAATNTVLRIANLFEQRAALVHGMPRCGGPERVKIEPEPEPKPPTVNIDNHIPVPEVKIENILPAAPAVSNSPSPGATATVETGKPSLVRTAVPWLLGALGGSGVAASALWAWFGKDAPVVPPPVVAEQEKDGSLLQYLEDSGFHLPEGTPWTQ
jgi:hypothetical protein